MAYSARQIPQFDFLQILTGIQKILAKKHVTGQLTKCRHEENEKDNTYAICVVQHLC